MKINYTFLGCLVLSVTMLSLALAPYPNETPRTYSGVEIVG